MWQLYKPNMKLCTGLPRLLIGYLMLAFLAAPLLGAHIHLSQSHLHDGTDHHHSIEAHSHLSLDNIDAGHGEIAHHHNSIELDQDFRGKSASKSRSHKPLPELALFPDEKILTVARVLIPSLLPAQTRLSDNYPCDSIRSRGPPVS